MFHWGEVQNALFWEVASLEISNSTRPVAWETSEKKTSHHISFHFPNHLVLPVKISQYSFWQNTLNKAFPGSGEVIKDGYMFGSAKNWKRTMYCTKLLHHTYTKIWTLSCRGISEHHGIFLERKKHTWPCIKVGCPRPAVTFSLLSSSPPKQTRVRFDSAIRSPVPQRDEEKRDVRQRPPHLRPAPPPPAMNLLSNRRLIRAAPRRHHSGPWFLWFRWYWNKKRKNRHRLVHSSESIETLQCITVT